VRSLLHTLACPRSKRGDVEKGKGLACAHLALLSEAKPDSRPTLSAANAQSPPRVQSSSRHPAYPDATSIARPPLASHTPFATPSAKPTPQHFEAAVRVPARTRKRSLAPVEITSYGRAWVYLPFALPLCGLYDHIPDLAFMRITNVTVSAMASGVFVISAPSFLPLTVILGTCCDGHGGRGGESFMTQVADGVQGACENFIAAATPSSRSGTL